MKVIQDAQDRHGNSCMIFDTTDLRKIYEWLYANYSGNEFKFGVLIDVPDEYAEPPKETYVYFLDEIAKEAAYYAGYSLAENR